LKDRPVKPWTEFSSDNTKIKSNIRLTKKGGKRLNKTKKIKKN